MCWREGFNSWFFSGLFYSGNATTTSGLFSKNAPLRVNSRHFSEPRNELDRQPDHQQLQSTWYLLAHPPFDSFEKLGSRYMNTHSMLNAAGSRILFRKKKKKKDNRDESIQVRAAGVSPRPGPSVQNATQKSRKACDWPRR
ncbi:hypothetical protein LY76DRAFT_180320 [Colletotrichum caudatum]|nr:hypothetical protein LY76DRAFT_180320 [Colletotrichum caudatum]